MKTWRFTFKCEYFGAQAEFPFFVDADTYHDATILADAYVKEKFPIACEQDLATIKFEGLGIDPKDWGKSKRELQEPCEYCNPAFINPFIDDDGLYLFIDKDRLMTGYSDECTFEKCESVKINYCPMCGREMEAEE